jgi:nitroimidazol reductase NimA-like FMN-containing flavoprotein (pyridoxamine 5'-phosphate oxidase superfamily)
LFQGEFAVTHTLQPIDLAPLPETPETRIRRYHQLQTYDRAELYALLDEALIAHVGFVVDGRAAVIPMGFARDGDTLLVHGSTKAGVLTSGARLTATVTQLDGLVYAATLYDSTFNFRSAVIVGTATELLDEDKVEGVRRLSDRIMPGRWQHVPPLTAQQLAATCVLRISFDQVSVKVRRGAPDDAEPGALWTGVVPLATVALAAQDQPGTTAELPPYVATIAGEV